MTEEHEVRPAFQGVVQTVHRGREVLGHIAVEWADKLDFKNRRLPTIGNEAEFANERRRLDEEWRVFLRNNYETLGHYFQNLYTVVKYVGDSTLAIDKKQYTNIVRAQLSRYELYLLFYHCLTTRNAPFKRLVEEYELLEQAFAGGYDGESLVPIPAQHYLLYAKKAFGEMVPTIFANAEEWSANRR